MKKITVPFIKSKKRKEKITMVTAYDYSSAKIADDAGIDIILVGDSLGMVIKGDENTLSVTLDEMIYHTKIAAKTAKNALVVADMPFMTYEVSPEQAVKNAGRIIKETGCSAVKLEGGRRIFPQIDALINANIPVMGHLGLTPQSVHALGGYKISGKNEKEADIIFKDAKQLDKLGVFSIVLEGMTKELGQSITNNIRIPTIGIGAGPVCDGQVLVFHDIVGLFKDMKPKFVRRYLEGYELMKKAVSDFAQDVKSGDFPKNEESY